MEEFNFRGCEILSFDEISSIEGGSIAYDLGHMIGSGARDLVMFLLLKKL